MSEENSTFKELLLTMKDQMSKTPNTFREHQSKLNLKVRTTAQSPNLSPLPRRAKSKLKEVRTNRLNGYEIKESLGDNDYFTEELPRKAHRQNIIMKKNTSLPHLKKRFPNMIGSKMVQ